MAIVAAVEHFECFADCWKLAIELSKKQWCFCLATDVNTNNTVAFFNTEYCCCDDLVAFYVAYFVANHCADG